MDFLLIIIMLVVSLWIAAKLGLLKDKRSTKTTETLPQHDGKHYIYGLIDPERSYKPFYIGRTTNPKRRLQQHKNNWGTTPKQNYILDMQLDGRELDMVILDSTWSEKQAKKLEKKYIARHRRYGHLKNARLG